MNALEILRGGAATTVQDAGRPGRAAFGLPPSGAMDLFAAEAANRLLGNEPGAALLEIVLRGPLLRVEAPVRVVLLGARFHATLDGRPAPFGLPFELAAGAELDLGAAADGARVFLAIAGGIEVPVVAGSRSTCLAAGFGGWRGRTLAAGDCLPLGEASAHAALGRAGQLFAPRNGRLEVRALPGPQWDRFPPEAHERFFASELRVDPRSDRVGVRLVGAPLPTRGSSDIPSEPAWPGAVQVPASGEAIVLGPDHPTTGGYAKLATVIAADLGAFAYLRPGDRVRFRPCRLDEARAALAARRAEARGEALRAT